MVITLQESPANTDIRNYEVVPSEPFLFSCMAVKPLRNFIESRLHVKLVRNRCNVWLQEW